MFVGSLLASHPHVFCFNHDHQRHPVRLGARLIAHDVQQEARQNTNHQGDVQTHIERQDDIPWDAPWRPWVQSFTTAMGEPWPARLVMGCE